MTSRFLGNLLEPVRRIINLPQQLKTRLQALESLLVSLQTEQQQLRLEQQQFMHAQQAFRLEQQTSFAEQQKLRLAHEALARHYEKLAGDHQQLQHNHDANIAWLQQMYPEIVSAIGKKIEPAQFDQLTQDVFAALHREIGAFSDRLNALQPATSAAPASSAAEDSRSAGFYLELERRFRGTAEEISGRVQPYLDLLKVDPELYAPVLDIGSGRGEWLALLAHENLSASGVDLNPINGDYCRSRGLQVSTDDALRYLVDVPSGTLGAVTAFHLVEHLPFPVLLALTDEILRVLKPGGLLIYETPNPENILVATRFFWIDPTHIKPLPPDLLQFLVMQRGFTDATVRRLHPGDALPTADATLQQLLSGPRDYAIIAKKPA